MSDSDAPFCMSVILVQSIPEDSEDPVRGGDDRSERACGASC